MRNFNSKKHLNLVLSSLSIMALAGDVVNAEPGDGTSWSSWSTTRTGNEGEVCQHQYRKNTVTKWSACDASHTTRPADRFYKQGKYDPKNCYKCYEYGSSCNSYGCLGD